MRTLQMVCYDLREFFAVTYLFLIVSMHRHSPRRNLMESILEPLLCFLCFYNRAPWLVSPLFHCPCDTEWCIIYTNVVSFDSSCVYCKGTSPLRLLYFYCLNERLDVRLLQDEAIWSNWFVKMPAIDVVCTIGHGDTAYVLSRYCDRFEVLSISYPRILHNLLTTDTLYQGRMRCTIGTSFWAYSYSYISSQSWVLLCEDIWPRDSIVRRFILHPQRYWRKVSPANQLPGPTDILNTPTLHSSFLNSSFTLVYWSNWNWFPTACSFSPSASLWVLLKLPLHWQTTALTGCILS